MSVTLSHSVIGDGPPVVAAHGLFGWKRNLATIAAALADTYTVFTLDLRNHGESPHADTMSYRDMAEDIARFVTSNGLGPVPLIGHSMGGKASMVLALTQPDLIAKLLVLDIAPIAYDRDYDHYVAALRNAGVSRAKRRSEIDALLGADFPEAPIRSFLMQNLTKTDSGEYGWRVNLDAIEAHMDDIMGFPEFGSDRAFEKTALFLAGSESDYITAAHQAEIERLFPLSDIDFIDGAGHWVHADQPDALAARLRSFLAD